MTHVSIEANSVDSDQFDLAESTLFVVEASKTFQQITKQTTFIVIGALRVKCLFAARKSIGGSARKKIPSPIAEKAEEKDVEMEVGCHTV